VAGSLIELGIISEVSQARPISAWHFALFGFLDVHDKGTYGAFKAIRHHCPNRIFISPERLVIVIKNGGNCVRMKDDILITEKVPVICRAMAPRTIASNKRP